MNFFRTCRFLCWVACCVALAPALLVAQEWDDAGQLYGQGVHAYFAGRTSDAETFFSRALATEARDPRFYYFRALSLMRLGRMDEARGDIMAGANLEAQHPGRFAIGSALQRVQGSHRLMLERYRSQGRADAASNRAQAERDRYPQTFRPESQVLRQKIVIPLDALSQPGIPRPLAPEELLEQAQSTPRRDAAGGPAAGSRPSAQPATDDPFRDDSAPRAVASPPAEAPTAPTEMTPQAEAMPEAETTFEAEADATPEADSEPTPDAEEDPFSDL